MNIKKMNRRNFLRGSGFAGFLAGLAACASSESTSTPAPTVPATSVPATATEAPSAGPSEIETTYFPDPPTLPISDEVSVRILWTGDSHGQLLPVYHREDYDDSFLTHYGIEPGTVEAYLCSNVDYLELAKKYGKVGGFAHIATLIEQERSQYPDQTLLLDSGDTWYGSAIALLTEGKANVEVMNAMGYEAITFHWEFNLGQDALLARIDDAQFPVLVQNLVDMENFDEKVLQSSMVKDMAGLKVAVVGQAYPFSMLTTEERPEVVNPGWRMGYLDDELQEEINRVRNEEGAEIVILLSHQGYLQDRLMIETERVTGIDVIVGAHTHDILWHPEQIGDTLILQGGSHGKFLGKLDLEIKDGKIVGYQHHLIPVLADQIEPDPAISDLITSLYEPYQEQLSKVIGETSTVLYRRSLFGGTTDAFMAHAYREIYGSDLGCIPGWRFGTTLLPGPITVEDVYNVMKPTPSPLYKARLKGKIIRSIIEDNLDNVFNADPLQRLGGDTLRCDGMTTDMDRAGERDGRTSNMRVNGVPIDEDQIYAVATSGGRTQTRDPESESTERPAVEELISFIENSSEPINPGPVQVFQEL